MLNVVCVEAPCCGLPGVQFGPPPPPTASVHPIVPSHLMVTVCSSEYGQILLMGEIGGCAYY